MRSVSSQCHLAEVKGVRSRRSRRVQSWQSQTCAILASGFVGEVKGCDLGAIRSQSWTAIWVCGAKSLGRWRSQSSWVAGNGLSLLPLSLSLSLSLSLCAPARSHLHTLSLSLSVFRKMVFEGKIKTEINLHHKHVRTEKNFRKMHFPCAIKHPHLRKRISGNHFQPIQTQP